MTTTFCEATPLPGPFFFPSDTTVEMGDKWEKQPIHYADQGNVDIVMSLDQAIYEGMLPLIQQYAKAHQLKIIVEKGTCGITAGDLIKKRIDIGGLCCPPGPRDRLPGVRFHTVGIAPIAILTHPDNRLKSVTIKQARALFSGDVYRWNQMPESNLSGSVHVVTRLHCKLRPGHWRQIIDDENDFSPISLDTGAVRDILEKVASDPKSIGYESPWMISRYHYTNKVRVLEIKRDTVASGFDPYPFFRTFNITTWHGSNVQNAEAEKLVGWLLAHTDRMDSRFHLISAQVLKAKGWKFNGDELIGRPDTDIKKGDPR